MCVLSAMGDSPQVTLQQALRIKPDCSYKLQLFMHTRIPSYAVLNGREIIRDDTHATVRFATVSGASNGTCISDGQFHSLEYRVIELSVCRCLYMIDGDTLLMYSLYL